MKLLTLATLLPLFLAAPAFAQEQIVYPGANQPDIRFGMQMPGTDDKQFALNILHWLSGALK